MRNTQQIGRALGPAVLVLAIAVVAIVLLSAGGDAYEVKARFQNASQLVKGNLVQVAGRPVGTVQDIDLTEDGQAEVRLKITEEAFTPLRQGVRATVRQASLSGVANRYIDLRLPGEDRAGPDIPEGGVLEQESTTTAVDLDQLFNTFDARTRKALSGVIQGFHRSYAGESEGANRGWLYLDPSLSASSRLFDELNRDAPTLRAFVRDGADLVTDIAARREDLAGLVQGLSRTTNAIAAERGALGESVSRLPDFMRRANTTFVNLRAALDDLEPLVDESKPVARKLRPFLAELRPLARGARPTLRDLSRLIRSDGADNDLVELTRGIPALRDATVKEVERNGAKRLGAFPGTVKALDESTPELATARPYAPELTGWFDDFSHSGLYDAVGGGSRAAPHVNLFAAVDGVLQPIPPELRETVFENAAQLRQRYRCPGSLERGTVWKPTPDFPCDETEVPPGR